MMSELRPVIVVGYRSRFREELAHWLLEPTPPKSITKDDTRERWIEAHHAKLRDEGSRSLAGGCLEEVVAYDFGRRESFARRAGASGGDALAVEFAAWLTRGYCFPEQPRLGWGAIAHCPLFVGFDAKEFLRVLGGSCARAGRPAPIGLWASSDAWAGTALAFDPFEALYEGDLRHVGTASHLLGEEWVGPEGLRGAFHVDAKADALLALRLVEMYGMCAATAASRDSRGEPSWAEPNEEDDAPVVKPAAKPAAKLKTKTK